VFKQVRDNIFSTLGLHDKERILRLLIMSGFIVQDQSYSDFDRTYLQEKFIDPKSAT